MLGLVGDSTAGKLISDLIAVDSGGRDDHQLGGVPVALTLQQLASRPVAGTPTEGKTENRLNL